MRKHAAAKLIAILIAAVCLALGIIGLVLPVIPGVLFLILAAALVARHSRRVGDRLRRHHGMRRALDHADGFLDSDAASKVKLALLYAAKAAVEGLEVTVRVVRRLLNRRGSGPDQSTFTI